MSYQSPNLYGQHGSHTKVLSIASGKGGVGKTTITSNLALSLASQGHKVLILDGDLGMANVDIMFGVRSQHHIGDILQGRVSVEDAIHRIDKNIDLLSGGSGLYEMSKISTVEKAQLIEQISEIGTHYDYMLVDTAPGISDQVLFLNSAAQQICVVITPDPASIADSYALMKVLNQHYREQRFSIICNQVSDVAQGKRLFSKINDICSKFLYLSLDYLGSIPQDKVLRQTTQTQKLVVRSHPDAISTVSIREIANELSGYNQIDSCKGSLQFFWRQLLGVA